MTGLSIIITTFNRSSVVQELLRSLAMQSDLDFEVIVAIDGSTDGTTEMLSKIETPYPLRWVDTLCKSYGLAVARNLGILTAQGKAIVILDDDSFPDTNFVAEHKRSVVAGVITGGPRYPADAENERMKWKMQELAKLPALTPMAIPELRRNWPNAYLIENNICMLREDLIGMGMFSERLKMYGFIGQEFFGRAEFLSLRYQYNHGAAVTHHGEFAGDNGLTTERKHREARRAALLRPSLMTSRHYRAQIAWAKARAEGLELPLPSFRARALLAVPWRYLHRAARQVRSKLRNTKVE